MSAVVQPDPWKRNPIAGQCSCGLKEVPAGVDGVNWYWQRHARDSCTLELPNLRCWCGLLRSEHLDGHAEAATRNASWAPIDTAPRDGTHILLANKAGVSEGGWLTDIDHGAEWEGQIGMAGWWRADGTDWPPTHWMPMPPPPTG